MIEFANAVAVVFMLIMAVCVTVITVGFTVFLVRDFFRKDDK